MHRAKHSDVKTNNVMMDASALYDEHPHPNNDLRSLDYSHPVKKHGSRVLRPVKYYYIDFGESKRCDLKNGPPRRSVADYVGDPAPEFRTEKYCDPFAVDVYRVGNIIRKNFTNVSLLSGTPICPQTLIHRLPEQDELGSPVSSS